MVMSKPPKFRKVQRHHVQLTPHEVEVFLHNCQLALTEYVDPEVIPALHYYKEQLVQLFHNSKFSPAELALVLTSVAWDIYNDKKDRTDKGPVGTR
jgi:hypothetical protein